MTNAQSNLKYSTSRPKPTGVDGSVKQAFLLAQPFRESMNRLIDGKIIAAIAFLNSDMVLQYQHAPGTLPDVLGTLPKFSLGNSQDELASFCPFTINLDDSHYLARMCEADMDLLGLDKPSPIPAEVIAAVAPGSGLIGNHYLLAVPKYIAVYPESQLPTGPISEVEEEFGSNGAGSEAWIQSAKSADTIAKQDLNRRLFNHATIQASLDTYILHRPAPACISTHGPAMTVTLGSFSAYPKQIEELKKMMSFKDHSANTTGVSQSIPATLTTGEDRKKEFISDRGLIQLQVQCAGGTIDFEKCTIDPASLTRATMTESYESIKKAPAGSRPDQLCDMMNLFISEVTSGKQGMNPLSHISIRLFTSDVSKLFLTGGFQTTPLNNMHDKRQLTSVGAATFMPQNLDDGLISKHAKAEEGERNIANANVSSSAPKEVRTALVALDKMEDRSPIKCVINALTPYRLLFDLATMESNGYPSIYQQTMMEVLSWMTTQVEHKIPTWKQATNDKMPHLKFVLFTIVDKMMVAFGKFGTSLHNVRIFEDPQADLSKLNTDELISFLKSFKAHRERFELLQSFPASHTDIPMIYRAVTPPEIAAAAVSPPGPTRKQKQQKQRLTEQQHVQKKQRVDPPQPRSSGYAPGMITLYEGKVPADAVPASLNICPEFVCKNYHCPHRTAEACGKLHVKDIKEELDARDRSTWAKHVQASKAGYFSYWKCKYINTNGPEWEGIVKTDRNNSPNKRA